MAKFSLRRYDNQARVSIVVSLASVVTLLGLVLVVFRNVDWSEQVIYYGKNRKLAVYGATALTLLLSTIGFGMGLSSAGQRRNDKQQLSWIGFFVGAGVLCLALIVFFIFQKRGESVIG